MRIARVCLFLGGRFKPDKQEGKTNPTDEPKHSQRIAAFWKSSAKRGPKGKGVPLNNWSLGLNVIAHIRVKQGVTKQV